MEWSMNRRKDTKKVDAKNKEIRMIKGKNKNK